MRSEERQGQTYADIKCGSKLLKKEDIEGGVKDSGIVKVEEKYSWCGNLIFARRGKNQESKRG